MSCNSTTLPGAVKDGDKCKFIICKKLKPLFVNIEWEGDAEHLKSEDLPTELFISKTFGTKS